MDLPPYTTVVCVPMDSPPTLDISNLESPSSLIKKRRRALKRAMDRNSQATAVVSKYRRKQRKLLDDSTESDPDPYDETYVFYCLADA
jgi:hypothetical protein